MLEIDISCPAVVGNFYTAIDILRNYISDFDIAVEFNNNPLISKALLMTCFNQTAPSPKAGIPF